MNRSKLLQLTGIFTISTLIAFFISLFTYDKLSSRTQLITILEKDNWVIGAKYDSYFNFDQIIGLAVQNIQNGNNEIVCNINSERSFGQKPISVINKLGIYKIEIVNDDKKNSLNCVSNILDYITISFQNGIRNRIEEIELMKKFSLKVIEENETLINEEYKNILKSKKINFSEFIQSVENKQIEELGIAEDFVTGTFIDNEKFYSISRGISSSQILISKLIENKVNFYIIEDNTSRIYREEYNRQSLRTQVQLNVLKSKLLKKPYFITYQDVKTVKISKIKFLFVAWFSLNFIGFLIFIFFNRELVKSNLIRLGK